MTQRDKLVRRILSGKNDGAIRFSELVTLLEGAGFSRRVRGDHHILTRRDIAEILNLQPKGGLAKPYQMKQVRELIVKYGVQEDDDGSEI